MAPGSQKWNGSCADLVNAARMIRPATTDSSVVVRRSGASTNTSAMLVVSVRTASRTTAPNSARPPIPVMTRARIAGLAPAFPAPATSRKLLRLVISQKTSSKTRSPDKTIPSIAAANRFNTV